ncbi:hypothetical protein BGX34_007842, partial [Mortierella sp. NVP85]
LSVMQAEVLDGLFATKPRAGEDANTYVERIDVMFRAANVPEMERGVIIKMVAELPDEGREKVLSQFKQVSDIPNLQDLFDFIRANHSILKGHRSDPFAWVVSRYGIDQPHQDDASAEPANIYPSTTNNRQGVIRHKKNQKGKGPQRPMPYNRVQNKGPATTGATTNGDLCKDPICRRYNRKHSDAACFRHTDKSKFDDLNRREANKVNKPQHFNKNHQQRTNKVAAMRARQAQALQEESLIDSLGNQLEYHNEDVEMSDYVD